MYKRQDRQQGILLRLVEAMDLIDEKHRRSTMVVQFGLGLVDGLPDVLHPGKHGRDGDESAVGRACRQAPQSGLAHTWRSPEDERVQPAGLEGEAQWFSRTQQMPLPHEFIERSGAQEFCQRRSGLCREQISQDRLMGSLHRMAQRSHAKPNPPANNDYTRSYYTVYALQGLSLIHI